MFKCSAQGCQSRASVNEGNLTFFRFPENQDLLTSWIRALRRDFWLPDKNSLLCSEHFTEDDFYVLSQRKYLKEDAVPSIFKGFKKQALKPKKQLVRKTSATKKLKPGVPVVKLVPSSKKNKTKQTNVQDTSSPTVKMKPGIPVVQLVRLPEEKCKKSSVSNISSPTLKNKSDLPLLKIISLAEEIKSIKPSAPNSPTETVKNKFEMPILQTFLKNGKVSRKSSVPDVSTPSVNLKSEIPVEKTTHPSSILQCLLQDPSFSTSENTAVQGISVAEGTKSKKSFVHNTPSLTKIGELKNPIEQVVPIQTEQIKFTNHKTLMKNVPPNSPSTIKEISQVPSVQNKPLILGQITNNKLVKYILLQEKIEPLKIKNNLTSKSSQDLNKDTSSEFQSSSDSLMPIILEVSSATKAVLPTQNLNCTASVPKTILPIQNFNNAVTVPETILPTKNLNHAVVVPKTILHKQNLNHSVPPILQENSTTSSLKKGTALDVDSVTRFYEYKLKYFQERCTMLQKKVKVLQQNQRRKDTRVASIKSQLAGIKKKHFVSENEFEQLKKSCPILAELLVRQLGREKTLPLPEEYSAQLQQFSLNLHHYSPQAYNYVRKCFNACLPNSRTINKWYQRAYGKSTSTKRQSMIQTNNDSMDVEFSRQESCFEDEECDNIEYQNNAEECQNNVGYSGNESSMENKECHNNAEECQNNDGLSGNESSMDNEECHNDKNFSTQNPCSADEEPHNTASCSTLDSESPLDNVIPMYMSENVNTEVS